MSCTAPSEYYSYRTLFLHRSYRIKSYTDPAGTSSKKILLSINSILIHDFEKTRKRSRHPPFFNISRYAKHRFFYPIVHLCTQFSFHCTWERELVLFSCTYIILFLFNCQIYGMESDLSVITKNTKFLQKEDSLFVVMKC